MTVWDFERLGLTEGVEAPPVGGGGGGPPPPVSWPPAPPPHKWGPREGMYVKMAPIHGLTPSGIFPGNDAFHFQCPPLNQFAESGDFNFQDYDTVDAGQHSQRVGRQLRTIAMDTIFVDWDPNWALAGDDSGTYPAQRAVKVLCKIRNAGVPFHLTVFRAAEDDFEVDYAATLRNVTWTIQSGENDAYYVAVTFTEFSTPDIIEYLAKSHPKLPVTLVVANLSADRNTEHKLARFYYGDPTKARVIAVFNKITGIPYSEVLTDKNVGKRKITVPVLKGAA